MPRVNDTRLQNWAGALIDDEDCMNEIRDRFQLRMLERFRTATPEVRNEINYIMDNEAAFFEELQAICDEARMVNETKEEEPIN